MTDDCPVRYQPLPTGRYVEARGGRERIYKGRYDTFGTPIEYWDEQASPPTATSSTQIPSTRRHDAAQV